MSPSSDRLGLVQMAAAMTLSGTLGVFVLESGQSAWNVVFFRCVFGALSLFLYCWARGLLKPGLFTARTLALALAAGAALVLNWVLLFSAYRLASISLATAVYNVQPFFLIGLGALFLGERPTRGKLAWSVIAFAGLLLVLKLTDHSGGDAYLSGLLLGLGAGFFYALYSIFGRFALRHYGPYTVTLYTFVFAGLAALVFLHPGELAVLTTQPKLLGAAAALVVVSTVLPYLLYTVGLARIDSGKAAILASVEPVVAALVGVLVFHETMDVSTALGVVSILAAVVLLRE